MLLTGCGGYQTLLNNIDNPKADPDDSPPSFIGPTVTIYFNGEVSVPALDGTYKWLNKNKRRNQ